MKQRRQTKMCKGLAIGLSKELRLECKGFSSHTDSGFDNGEYLKLELIINDTKPEGYELLVDTENDDELCAMFLIDGKLKAETYSFVMKEIKKKEVEYLRFLLKNMSYAEAGENQDMRYCEAGENQDMRSCEAGKNQDMRYCEAGENQDMRYCEAGENQNMSGCNAGKNQDMRYCEAGENQDMSYCNAGENQDMSYCNAKKRIISYMQSDNPENNKFIKKLSDEAEDNKLDWDYLVELARKGYKKRRMENKNTIKPRRR